VGLPESVGDLIERFVRNVDDYVRPGYKEARARAEFIDPIFEALGWDVSNRNGWGEAYKEVVHEDSLDVEGATKAPDYSFRVGGTRKFFVEAKAPHVNIDRGQAAKEASFQLRRYAWSAKLPLSIVTNVRTIAVYESRKQPKVTQGPAIERIMLIPIEDLATRWDEFAGIFAKESILRGSFDSYAAPPRGDVVPLKSMPSSCGSSKTGVSALPLIWLGRTTD
jgi:predicted type IV restriction endonuclease